MDVPHTLAIDLDGTLSRADLGIESILRSFRIDFWGSLGALLHSRAALKAHAARVAPPRSAPPWNSDVVSLAQRHAEEGGRLVLATGSSKQLADWAATESGLQFTSVIASDAHRNLVGAAKSKAISSSASGGDWGYVGNSLTDRQVSTGWKRWASNSGVGLRESGPWRDNRRLLSALCVAIRPKHWLKNVLVLAVPLAARMPLTVQSAFEMVMLFLSFSCIASAGYLVNDSFDADDDRAHPEKSTRPIAAGVLDAKEALSAAAILSLLGVLAATALAGPVGAVIAIAYLAGTLIYSFSVKAIPLLDIFWLLGLYGLRVLAGAVVGNLPVSIWFGSFVGTSLLSLCALKRYVELRSRGSVRGYNDSESERGLIRSLGISASIASSLTLLLYAQAPSNAGLYPSGGWLVPAACCLVYAHLSLWLRAGRNELHSDPVIAAIRRPAFWVAGIATAVGLIGSSGGL